MKIGILALQGAVDAHVASFSRLGIAPVTVRTPAHLDGVDAIVVPGGESTTMSLLLERQGLFEPLAERLAGGMPAFGTCAGMILLAAEVLDGRADQRSFGAIDLVVRRNAFGRQVDSFEALLDVEGLAEGGLAGDGLEPAPVPAVFIRAPIIESAGAEVEVLARVDGAPVLARQGPVLVAAFHPELSDDLRIHQLFIDSCS